jgi:thiamine kinase-like enzyme
MDELLIAEKQVKEFLIYGDFKTIKKYGNGHINSTYMSMWDQAGKTVKYIHQKINKKIFANPKSLMENIVSVTKHLKNIMKNNASKRCLELVKTNDGKYYSIDKNNDYWRTYLFIENTLSLEIAKTPEQVEFLGKTIGEFQNQVSSYNGPELKPTIPNFHNMRTRYEAFYKALSSDKFNRANSCKSEIDFFIENEKSSYVLIDDLESGKIPMRITHNDTKMNNILISKKDPNIVCVIDLDTIMMGSALFDFGDLVRTGTNTAKEDEKDIEKVKFNINNYNALKKGYLSQAKEFLTKRENELLEFSGRYLTQIVGLRFLTDYLLGDIYFATKYETHNLIRANTQIALIKNMRKHFDV